jgi:hypothetical protein
MNKCIVDGCNNEKYHSKFYCSMHYRRLKFTGTLSGGKKERLPLVDRFWKKVQKTNGCWIWTGGKQDRGYGVIGSGGKGGRQLLAHRYSYQLHHGEIPDGLVVMHSCDNPSCVNPAHLSAGTWKDNTVDALKKGRLKTIFGNGENNARAKLKEDDVRYIKSHPEIRSVDLAKMFNVSPQTICCVRKGRHWSSVPT